MIKRVLLALALAASVAGAIGACTNPAATTAPSVSTPSSAPSVTTESPAASTGTESAAPSSS
jgi:hypothetical protein